MTLSSLMPRQPMYVAYLPDEAQHVIGKVHLSTAPARRLLEQEGMYFEGYIDIFDGGPVLQARVSELRAVRDSALAAIDPAPAEGGAHEGAAEPFLVSNTQLRDFRIIVSTAQPLNDRIALSHDEQKLLRCQGIHSNHESRIK